MTSSTTNRALWRGARDSLPFVFVAGPFGLLFGVVSSDAGLHVTETFFFSVSVFAGAAQFTALQLMQEHAPTLIVLISALAVNLRCAMYSAALTPHLGAAPMWQRAILAYFNVDQTFALAQVKKQTMWTLMVKGAPRSLITPTSLTNCRKRQCMWMRRFARS